MAPDASERTTLQENTGADTVAVINAKFLYVEYGSHFTLCSPTFLINYTTQTEIKQQESQHNKKRAGQTCSIHNNLNLEEM